MDVSDAKRRPRKPLIKGRKMVCPRCEGEFDILQYIRLQTIEEYEDDTTPVYKCPKNVGGCGFLFAPADTAVRSSLTG